MIVVSCFRVGFLVLNWARWIVLNYLTALFIQYYLLKMIVPQYVTELGGQRLSLLQTLT